MRLKPVDTVDVISPEDFRKNYYDPKKPLIIKDLAKNWPAYSKWNWDYFIDVVGDKEVGVYNNVKSDSYTPINTADGYMKFGEYLRKVKAGPLDLRIFLFNIFQHAPHMLLKGRVPALLRPLAGLGRWSLSFYMLHQPVFIGAILLYLHFRA